LLALFVVAMAVVVLLLGWGMGANGRKRVGGTRQAARRRPESEGGRGLSETREAYPEGEVMEREGLPSDTQPEGRMLPSATRTAGSVFQSEERTLPSAVGLAGYVFLCALAFAAGVVLGIVIAVGMDYLVGWPDTWWWEYEPGPPLGEQTTLEELVPLE
jgi:hypothetical protein